MNTIKCQDCIDGMKQLPDKSIDIIIADPPYNIGKDFGNNKMNKNIQEYLLWSELWINQCLRVLKDNGTLYIYGFSEILAYIRVFLAPPDEVEKCKVKWLVWHYTNKTVPRLKNWQRSHESILMCFKNTFVFNIDDIREPYTEQFVTHSAGKTRSATKGRFSSGEKTTVYNANPNGALPRDVLKTPALSGSFGKKERVDHPTQKPLALCERLLSASRNKDDATLLLVPFAGSGSECVAAKKLGIDFIAFEINPEYILTTQKRLQDIILE